jgi:cadmium resistance protein CadD (predicted permease)
MNWWVIFLTFIAVNLDFFVILIFLLNRYRTRDVIIGYSLGLVLLLAASFFIGKLLSLFLPEWLLGILGILPIYMVLHDNDEDPTEKSTHNPILNTFITYLAVCSGCNLSIFLPVLTGLSFSNFLLVTGFIIILAIIVVTIVKLIGNLPVVKRVMDKYGEPLMKIIYIGVGLYVFWDSGLISHLVKLLV